MISIKKCRWLRWGKKHLMHDFTLHMLRKDQPKTRWFHESSKATLACLRHAVPSNEFQISPVLIVPLRPWSSSCCGSDNSSGMMLKGYVWPRPTHRRWSVKRAHFQKGEDRSFKANDPGSSSRLPSSSNIIQSPFQSDDYNHEDLCSFWLETTAWALAGWESSGR